MRTITLGEVAANLEELKELKMYMESIETQLERTPEENKKLGLGKQRQLDIDILNNTRGFLQYRIDGLSGIEIKLDDEIPF